MALRKLGITLFVLLLWIPAVFGDPVAPSPITALENRTSILEVKIDNALQLQSIAYQNGMSSMNGILTAVLAVFSVITGIFAFMGISNYTQMKMAQIEVKSIVDELTQSRDSIRSMESELKSLGTKFAALVEEKVRGLSDTIRGNSRDGFEEALDDKLADAVIFVNENKADPTPDERFLLAATHYRSTDYEEAETILKALRPVMERSAKYWNALGLIKLQQENVKDAYKYFTVASDLEPENWKITLNLVLCMKNQGKFAEALQLVLSKELISKSGGAWIVQLNLAALLIDLGNYDEALAMLDQAEKQFSERNETPNARVPFNRACAYAQLKRKEDAVSSLKAAWKQDGTIKELAFTDPHIRSSFSKEELEAIFA